MLRNVLVAIVAIGITGIASLHAKDPPKKLVLDTCKSKQPGVAFDHEQHAKKLKIACKSCHHTGKNVGCSTAKCHAGKAEGKRPGCAEAGVKKNPFHISCISCHKKENKGPKTCKQCHK